MLRPICNKCNKNACAPNYYKDNKRYWRKKCAICLEQDKKQKRNSKIRIPKWKEKGYKKKNICDLCGFKSLYSSQIIVFHVDGNLNNNEFLNLRSICLCCVEVVKRKHITWKIGDLLPD